MSELDVQKERVGWYKDLFKWLLTVLLALSAGLVSLAIEQKIGLLFYIGLTLLVILSVYSIFLADKVLVEINKLKEL